jgi:hypothetical protein
MKFKQEALMLYIPYCSCLGHLPDTFPKLPPWHYMPTPGT